MKGNKERIWTLQEYDNHYTALEAQLTTAKEDNDQMSDLIEEVRQELADMVAGTLEGKLRAELDEAKAENKLLKLARCPCGGWLEGIGIMTSTQIYTYQCDKCGARLEITGQALKGE